MMGPDPQADGSVLDAIDGFCREVLEPRAAEIDAKGLFATCHRQALSGMGIMGLCGLACCLVAEGGRLFGADDAPAGPALEAA